MTEEEAPARKQVTVSLPTVSARTAGLAVLAAVLLAVAVVQTLRVSDKASAENTRDEIAASASALGKALMSYDFEDLDASRDRVLALSTKAFADKYREAFDEGLKPLITQLQAVANAVVRRVYVSEIENDAARAVVVIDSEVKSDAGVRQLDDSYLEMGLRKVSGKWRVNDVTAVAASGESLTPTPGATPTTSPG